MSQRLWTGQLLLDRCYESVKFSLLLHWLSCCLSATLVICYCYLSALRLSVLFVCHNDYLCCLPASLIISAVCLPRWLSAMFVCCGRLPLCLSVMFVCHAVYRHSLSVTLLSSIVFLQYNYLCCLSVTPIIVVICLSHWLPVLFVCPTDISHVCLLHWLSVLFVCPTDSQCYLFVSLIMSAVSLRRRLSVLFVYHTEY